MGVRCNSVHITKSRGVSRSGVRRLKAKDVSEGLMVRTDSITSESAVIRPRSIPRAQITSYKPTYQAEYGLLRNSNMATVGVGCHQIVQSEQSHECPPARAVPEPPSPLHGIPHVGGRPAAAGSRVRGRPL